MRDRSGASESLVTSPAHTRSQSASSSTSSVDPSPASEAARTSSGQKDAPRAARCSRRATCSGLGSSSPPSSVGSSRPTWSRKTGGPGRRWRRGRRRPPTPARPRCRARRGRPAGSRACGRAARRPRAPTPASGAPWRMPSTSASPSSPGAAADALPGGQEPGQRLGLDRLDLAAQRGERAPPQLAEHLVVAPLTLDAVGPELAPHDAAVDLEALERLADPGLGRRRGRRRPGAARNGPWVRAKRATRSTQRVVDRVGERGGQAEGQRAPSASRSRAASSAAATRSSPATATRIARRSATSWSIHATTSAPSVDADVELGHGEGPEVAQQVVELVGDRGPAGRRRGAGARARGRPARRRRAARAAPRRRAARGAGRGRARARRPAARPAARRPRTCRRRSSRTAATARTATPAGCRPRRRAPCGCAGRASTSRSAGRSNTSFTHSRVGLEQDRERRVLRGHREQVGGLLPLLPQRRAAIGPAARQQQGPGRATHGTATRTSRCRAAARHDEVVDLVGIDDQLVEGQLVDGLGQAEHDAVVAPHELDVDAPALAQPGLEGHRPGRVDLGAERATARTPASRRSRRGTARRRSCGRRGRAPVTSACSSRYCEQVAWPPRSSRSWSSRSRGQRLGRRGSVRMVADELAHRPAELERAAGPVAVPERHLPGLARARA